MSDESGSEAKAGAKALSGLIQLTSHQIAVIYLEECYRLKLRADFAKEDKAKEDKAKEKGFVKRFLGFFNSAFGIWLLTLLAATVLPGVWSLGVHMLNAQDQRDQRLERLFLELKYRASKVDEAYASAAIDGNPEKIARAAMEYDLAGKVKGSGFTEFEGLTFDVLLSQLEYIAPNDEVQNAKEIRKIYNSTKASLRAEPMPEDGSTNVVDIKAEIARMQLILFRSISKIGKDRVKFTWLFDAIREQTKSQ